MSVIYKSSNLSDKKGSKEVYFASFFCFKQRKVKQQKIYFEFVPFLLSQRTQMITNIIL